MTDESTRSQVTRAEATVAGAALGPRAWRFLHLTGGYYLWLQFMVSFGKRIPGMPLYTLFLIPLLAVIVLDTRPAETWNESPTPGTVAKPVPANTTLPAVSSVEITADLPVAAPVVIVIVMPTNALLLPP